MEYDDISQKQSEILDYIKQHIEEYNVPPSVREICLGVGLKSTSSVHGHLNTLEKKGYIKRDGAKSRCIGLSDNSRKIIQPENNVLIPVIKNFTDAASLLEKENIESYISLPFDMCPEPGKYLFLHDPENAHDLALVKMQNTVDNGDTAVVVFLDNIQIRKFDENEIHPVIGKVTAIFKLL